MVREGTRAIPRAFTIIEVLLVIAIIIILAGLILSTVGYVQKKGARSRAEAEIAAMSAALESYKADNGIYPRDATKTDQVDPAASPIPTTATQFLYEQLSGNSATNLQPISGAKSYFAFKPQMLFGISGNSATNLQPISGAKSYFAFKPQMLFGTKDSNGNLTSVSYIRDPFGNSYGYSTLKASGGTGGYNPTFDLWSIADDSSGTNQTKWIKNW